jgi:hypothetical protein
MSVKVNMSSSLIQQLDASLEKSQAAEALSQLCQEFETQRDYHQLFDAELLKKKWELGLPLGKPTSFHDVPEKNRKEFEETYIAQARRIGQMFLQDQRFQDAWMYYRILGEKDPIYQALEALPVPENSDGETDSLVHLALYQKVHPVKGLKIMLGTSGMCNTITASDQIFVDLTLTERQQVTQVLADAMYDELVLVLTREVRKKVPLLPPGPMSLRQLILGREWLFEDNNYHVDVSHLNAVVRFARCLPSNSPTLDKVIELAEYGSHLGSTLQYPGEPPFEDFYTAHLAYFDVVNADDPTQALKYFQDKLAQEPDATDQQLISFVLVDLYVRRKMIDAAAEIAAKHLTNLPVDAGFSFREFCLEHQQYGQLSQLAKDANDPLLYLTAALEKQRH